MGPGVSRNEILYLKSCNNNIASKELVASKAPYFEFKNVVWCFGTLRIDRDAVLEP